MKSPGPVRLVLVLLTLAWASSLPAKESTTRRYNFTDGHNTGNKTLLSIYNTKTTQTNISTQTTNATPRKISYSKISTHRPNRTKIRKHKYRTTIKPVVNMLRITTASEEMANNKNKENNDVLLIHGFFNNNIEDLNSPNKTLKIVGLNKTVTITNSNKRKPPKSIIKIGTTNQPPKQQIKTSTTKIKTNKVKNITNHTRKLPKTTTFRPINTVTKQKAWPNTNIKTAQDLNRYKNYTELPTKKKKQKPVVHKVISKWSDKPPYNEFKESWYDHGIPIPTPNPEISTYGPQVSINPAAALDAAEDDVEITELSSPSSPTGTLLNEVTLDMNSDDTRPAGNAAGGQRPDCPTVHLTNSVFGPAARQECSDLSIAINTHIHSNPVPEALPESVESDALETADTSPVEVPAGVVGDTHTAPVEEAAAAPAAAAPATNAAASPGGGGSGGGFPGLPTLPGLPEFNFPDILGLIRTLALGWNLLRWLFGVLSPLAPLLWILPLLSFLFGFSLVLPFFPWWLPFVFFFAKKKAEPKQEVYFHKHVHKPIHHHDGWFWNHNTKTWTNLADYVHRRSDDDQNRASAEVYAQIEKFSEKYKDEDQNSQSWKRRKK